MNWVVVGQGAIGLLWYHHLSLAKKTKTKEGAHLIESLSLLASQRQKVTQNNYSFTSLDNQVYNGTINFAQIEQLQEADTILLCLKSYQISQALTHIAPHLKTSCNIILAHNGMGTLESLSEALIKQHNIYAMLTTHGSLRTKQLNITHTGAGASNLGLVSGKKNSLRDEFIASTLSNALPLVTLEDNIAYKQWLKLAINCVINPITALYDIDNGLVNEDKFTDKIAKLLVELVAVAKTQGVVLEKEGLQTTVQDVALKTAKNCSSMRCDILENRKTEIDYINGYVHQIGQKNALATPENTKMWQAIKSLEAK